MSTLAEKTNSSTSSSLGQLLASARHSIALKYSLISELPVLSVYIIKNSVTTTINHVETHYHQPLKNAILSVPNNIIHRFFGFPQHTPEIKSKSSDGQDQAIDSCLDQAEIYLNWTLEDVLHQRFDRQSLPFTPPSTWTLPMSIAIVAVRSMMHNDVSLNVMRSLSDFSYQFYPPSFKVFALPEDGLSFDKSWFTHGILPIYRFDNVVPDGFDFDLKFKYPQQSTKTGKLSLTRFSVHIGSEGYADTLGGEYMTCDQIISQRQGLMVSLFGSETVESAKRLYKVLKKAEKAKWWCNTKIMEKLKMPIGKSVKSQNTASKSLICFSNEIETELVNCWNDYRTYFQRLNVQENLKKLKQGISFNEKVILYLHGGGYCVMSASSHRGLAWQISKESDCIVIGINYRRTPEYHFPAALVDAMSAYLQLIYPQPPTEYSHDIFDYLNSDVIHPAVLAGTSPILSVSPDRIIIMGDSAGGGLVMSLLLHIRDSGYPMPAGACLLSPWLDLTCSLPTWNKNDTFDYLPRMDTREYENIMSAYTNWRDELLVHPLVSPLYADVNNLCPILVQVGQREYLLDDSLMLAEKMKNRLLNSNLFRLEVYQDMIHVWHFLELPLPARIAFKRIGKFVNEIVTDDFLFQNTRKDAYESGFVHEDIMREEAGIGKYKKNVETLFISYDGNEYTIDGKLKLGGEFQPRPILLEMK